MVKIAAIIAFASLALAAKAYRPSSGPDNYERELPAYEQEAREFDEYLDVLGREPEPLGIGGAIAGASAGTGLLGGLLSAIGNVVPGKAGEGLKGAGQVITGVGKGLTGRSEIPDEVQEYVARNIDEEDVQYLREFYDKYSHLVQREPEPIFGGLLSTIGKFVPGKAGEGLRGAGNIIGGIIGRSELPDNEYAARDFDDFDERELGWEDADYDLD